MEVPGSTAGLETACPYCHTTQPIPLASAAASPALPRPAQTAATSQAGASAGYQPAIDWDPLAIDLSNVNSVPQNSFSNNPYSAPGDWSQTTSRVSGITFSRVFGLAFESLFPSCLIAILHFGLAIIFFVVVAVIVLAVNIIMRTAGSSPETTVLIIRVTTGLAMIPGIAFGAWYSAALRHTAFRAVCKRPFEFGQCFSANGAFLTALTIAILGLVGNGVWRAPQFIEYLAPNTIGGFARIWVFLCVPFLLGGYFCVSLAYYAAMDGDNPLAAIGTSVRILFTNLPVVLAIKLVMWLITIPLTIVTLGWAMVIPMYFNAAIYRLATKSR